MVLPADSDFAGAVFYLDHPDGDGRRTGVRDDGSFRVMLRRGQELEVDLRAFEHEEVLAEATLTGGVTGYELHVYR